MEYPPEIAHVHGKIIRAARRVVDGCDLPDSAYSSVERAALTELRELFEELDAVRASGGRQQAAG